MPNYKGYDYHVSKVCTGWYIHYLIKSSYAYLKHIDEMIFSTKSEAYRFARAEIDKYLTAEKGNRKDGDNDTDKI